jgi:hypothetical protein
LSEEPKDENRRISAEITEFALELLEGSKDLKSAMNMLLMKIGRRFRLAAVSVREYGTKDIPELSYLWSNMETPMEQPLSYISLEERRRIKENFRKNQILEISNDPNAARASEVYRQYHDVLTEKVVVLRADYEEILAMRDLFEDTKTVIWYSAKDEEDAKRAMDLVEKYR